MLAEEQACAGASDWAACWASRLPTPRARGRRVRLSGRLGTAALKEMAKVIRDGHRTHCADVGAAGVSRWNPDSREERRRNDTNELAEDLSRVSCNNAVVEH